MKEQLHSMDNIYVPDRAEHGCQSEKSCYADDHPAGHNVRRHKERYPSREDEQYARNVGLSEMVTEMPFQVQFDPQARISFACNYALINKCQAGMTSYFHLQTSM